MNSIIEPITHIEEELFCVNLKLNYLFVFNFEFLIQHIWTLF